MFNICLGLGGGGGGKLFQGTIINPGIIQPRRIPFFFFSIRGDEIIGG